MTEKTPKKRTRRELEIDNEVMRRGGNAHGLASVLRTGIKWGAIGFLGWQARISIEVLAGKSTVANLAVAFLAEAGVSDVLAWLVAAFGILWGMAQRRMRHNLLARQGHRIPELERKIDPKRTSSDLTSRGETNPADRE